MHDYQTYLIPIIVPASRDGFFDGVRDACDNSNSLIVTEQELRYFGDYGPYTIMRINRSGYDLKYNKDGLLTHAQTLLAYTILTIDRGILRSSTENIRIKAHRKHRRVGQAHDMLGLNYNKDSPTGDLETLRYALFEIKHDAIGLLMDIADTDGLPKKELEIDSIRNFGYVSRLRDILGENLVYIILYGSNAFGDGNDYDNLVVVQDLTLDVYDSLRDLNLQENGKPVSTFLVPVNSLAPYIACDPASLFLDKQACVIYGSDCEIPDLGPERAVQLRAFSSAEDFRSMRRSLNWGLIKEDYFRDKPRLLGFLLEKQIWIGVATLQLMEGGLVDKDRVIRHYGIQIPALSDGWKTVRSDINEEDVRDLLIGANFNVSRMIGELYGF